jgi:RNA polymerase sigma factor (sigma-70 family)
VDDQDLPSVSNAELVRRIAAGGPNGPFDTAAEAELYRRFRRQTLFLIRHRTHYSPDAEDLCQEALITVILKLRESAIEEPEKLAAYVRNTAIFTCIMDHRKKKRRKTDSRSDIIDDFPHVSNSPEKGIQEEDMRAALQALINEMTVDRDRELLRLLLLDEDKKNICKILDVTPVHCDRVKSRAVKRLRELLIERGVDPDDLGPWEG